MDKTYKKILDSFTVELIAEGDFWRIFRRGTLIDLIKLNFFHFQKTNKEKYLIEIITH